MLALARAPAPPVALRPAVRRLSLPARPPVAALRRPVALPCPGWRLRVGAAAAVRWRGALLGRGLATGAGGEAARGTSRHRGVHWHERDGKWQAQLMVDGKVKHLGYFEDEEEAARAVDDELRERGLQEKRGLNFPREGEKSAAWSSEFRGVSIHKASGKWRAQVQHQGSRRHVGLFTDEAAAARAVDAKAAELQALDQGTDPSFNFPAEWEWEWDWVVGGSVHLEEGSTGAWRRVGT